MAADGAGPGAPSPFRDTGKQYSCFTFYDTPWIPVRSPFLQMTSGDVAGAMLLAFFDFKTLQLIYARDRQEFRDRQGQKTARARGKAPPLPQDPIDLWIDLTQAQMVTEMMGAYSLRTIKEKLGLLEEKLQLITSRKAPYDHRVDQYLLRIDRVQAEIDKCIGRQPPDGHRPNGERPSITNRRKHSVTRGKIGANSASIPVPASAENDNTGAISAPILHAEIAPNSAQIDANSAPIARQSAPIARQSAPIARQSAPIARQSAPNSCSNSPLESLESLDQLDDDDAREPESALLTAPDNESSSSSPSSHITLEPPPRPPAHPRAKFPGELVSFPDADAEPAVRTCSPAELDELYTSLDDWDVTVRQADDLLANYSGARIRRQIDDMPFRKAKADRDRSAFNAGQQLYAAIKGDWKLQSARAAVQSSPPAPGQNPSGLGAPAGADPVSRAVDTEISGRARRREAEEREHAMSQQIERLARQRLEIMPVEELAARRQAIIDKSPALRDLLAMHDGRVTDQTEAGIKRRILTEMQVEVRGEVTVEAEEQPLTGEDVMSRLAGMAQAHALK